MNKYFAHSPNQYKDEWEPLSVHLEAVAVKTAEFCKDFGFFELGYLCGLYHDIGKYQEAFQKRLRGDKSPVEHSICGAKEILSLIKNNKESTIDQINAEMLAYIIAGHHSGLPNIGTASDNSFMTTLFARLNRDTQDFLAYKNEIGFDYSGQNGLLDFEYIDKKEKDFAVSILVRMLFSSLVDADSLQTEAFYRGDRKYSYDSFEELNRALEKNLQSFVQDKLSGINKNRNQIQKMCLNMSLSSKGIYSLTVPTGGGKTLSSMVFAIKHLLHHGHKRIIYVIPYTSIIEQTSRIFKKIFGENNVLEHHSNFTFEDKDNGEEKLTDQSFATENWDAPIVITTNVQFFESLFSSKRGAARKIHNIANSVIIFDEAQMIPLHLLAPCMKSVDILTRNFGCTALLMSATCPNYLPFMCKDAKITEINTDYRQHFLDFRRTGSKFLGKKQDNQIISLINFDEQTLVVLNTRRHASSFYNSLPKECNKYHLSTLMHPKHRADTIKKIKADLSLGIPCVVVSTQLIECGVDLDFATVFRSLAGIDSIVQAAGRCNREGKRKNSTVYIFESELDPKRGDIQIYKNFARIICSNSQQDDILTLENIETYFDYILDPDEVLPDKKEILGLFKIFQSEFYLNFKFDDCNNAFKYIEENNKFDIIVPSDEESKRLLEKFNHIKTDAILKTDYQKLSRYTVSIYNKEIFMLQSQCKIERFGTSDRTFVLCDLDSYKNDVGLSVSINAADEILIC